MFQDTYIRRVTLLVGVAAIAALSAYTYYAFTQAQNLEESPATITVTGEGEIFAKPDIATFSFSVNARETDATTAQSKSAESINAIVGYLKEKGVEEKDIRTEYYNLSPRYEYDQVVCPNYAYCPPGEQKLAGYEVTQSISVKVRKIGDVGMLISGVGELGATNLNGPAFTIDDEEGIKDQAREAAITDAKEKAQVLARDLGVRLVRITGFSENEMGVPYYGAAMNVMKAVTAEDTAIAPDVPVGENTITSRVSISYEVR